MPPYAAWLRYPDGSTAVVHSSKPIKACICQAKVSAYLCDYPVGEPELDHNASRDIGGPVYTPPTCDAPLCDDCRVPQGPEIDYCPSHASEISHDIDLSEDIHLSDRSRISQIAHVTDERGQEYLL